MDCRCSNETSSQSENTNAQALTKYLWHQGIHIIDVYMLYGEQKTNVVVIGLQKNTYIENLSSYI